MENSTGRLLRPWCSGSGTVWWRSLTRHSTFRALRAQYEGAALPVARYSAVAMGLGPIVDWTSWNDAEFNSSMFAAKDIDSNLTPIKPMGNATTAVENARRNLVEPQTCNPPRAQYPYLSIIMPPQARVVIGFFLQRALHTPIALWSPRNWECHSGSLLPAEIIFSPESNEDADHVLP